MTGGRLRRLAVRRTDDDTPRERCDLCGDPVPAEHRHVLDLTVRELRCACRACQVLFDHTAAGGGHYRLVPRRRERVTGFTWAGVGAPVRTVFLVRDSESDRPVMYYPSPAGAVAGPAWDDPLLARVTPDVEALLLDRDHGAWIVPIDDCYRLVGMVRAHWHGLTGGPEAREQIARFFAELADLTEERSPA
ncbi:DUF5947 family protein [Spongiactinospora sp. TRM90649]|uniref:DUF5947 family protein n=1 Tax=Spongiactinospora sp. TRM90649 TaxID=3031114 RepID=UPI0023F91EE4|nr:DUF5947 family protein [Spongiactinospora sp. TRM90649]MDF5751749.1 DUF5947 family protein [Spongiactinospora sp. TRM90649]